MFSKILRKYEYMFVNILVNEYVFPPMYSKPRLYCHHETLQNKGILVNPLATS